MGLTDLFDISLERANQFYTWGWRLSVVGAVVTMLGIAALWLGTRVRDHDFELRISETTLSAEQLRQDNLTLQTNLETERIARLKLEGKTEEIRLDIAKSNQAAEEAKERILNASKEVAKLQTDAADAKRSLAEAETRLALVSKQQMPRSQRIPSDRALSILKTAPPGKAIIRYKQADPESATFAMGLNMRLRDAGWQILGFNGIPSTTEMGATNSDVLLLTRDPAGWESDSVQALIEVFNEGAITVMGTGDPKLPDGTTLIMINPR